MEIVYVRLGIMLLILCLGFPMMLAMILAPLIVMAIYMPGLEPLMMCQYFISGISTFTLLAVPMFIFAANIMSHGEMADRLIGVVRSFVGHIHGGLAVTVGGTCTIFGAISGSTIATLAAIGPPMYKPMIKQGYSVSHTIATLMSNANIAMLIPPSVVMIQYCVVCNVSIGDTFKAGIVPGVLLFVIFSIYEYFYARWKKISVETRATFPQILHAIKRAVLPLGFPVVVLGGIYSGLFSPTEAAAASCLYAIVLEAFIYRTLSLKDLFRLAYDAGRVNAAMFILNAGGKAFSTVITYAKIPSAITSALLGEDPSAAAVLFTISLFFLVACCFVDSLPVIIIVCPIFYSVAMQTGINPVHLGIVVTVWSAIGCITPPFGCNIFAACGLFNQKFVTVVRGIIPHLTLYILFAILICAVPAVCLWIL